MMTFELKLDDGRVVRWDGQDGMDAAVRYADIYRGSVIVAWRRPQAELLIWGGDR